VETPHLSFFRSGSSWGKFLPGFSRHSRPAAGGSVIVKRPYVLRFIGILLLLTLPGLGLALYTGLEQRRAAAVAVQQHALDVARLVVAEQEALVERTRYLLAALSQSPTVRRVGAAECRELLARLLRTYRGYVSLGVVDTTGALACSAPQVRGRVSLADRAWFRQALATREFAVGEYVVGRVSGKPSVGVGHPIVDDAGNFEGVVWAGLDLDWLGRLAARTAMPPGTTVTVLDRTGLVIARLGNRPPPVGTVVADSAIVRRALAGGSGTVEADGLDGRRRLHAFLPLGSVPAFVVIGVPTEVAFGEADRILRRNLVTLGLTAVGTAVLAWLGIVAGILRRLRAMTAASRRLAAGDLSARAGGPPGVGEFAEMARAFDAMAETLEARTARLRMLSHLNRVVSSSLDLDEVLTTIARTASELTGAPVVSFWLVDEDAGTATLRGFAGPEGVRDFDPRPLTFGEGGIGWVAAHRRPLDVPDVFAPDSPVIRLDWHRRHGLSSFHGVPVLFGDSPVAVLSLNGRAPFRFGPDDLDLLDGFVSQAAVAIHNARLYRLSEARRQTAEALADLSRLIAETLDLKSVASRVADSVRRLLGTPLAAVYQVEPGSGDLVMLAVAKGGDVPFDWNQRLPRGVGASGLAVEQRQTVVTSDVLSDARLATSPDVRAVLEESQFRALAAVPCVVADRAIGVLAARDVTGRGFSEDSLRLARAFADEAAVAMDNARLLQDAVRQADRMAALIDISRLLLETLDPHAVARRVVDSVCDLLGAQSSCLYRLDPSGSLVAVVASAGGQDVFPWVPMLPAGVGLSGRAVAEGRPAWTPDVLTDPLIERPARARAGMERELNRARLAIPLVARGRLLGVVVVIDSTGRAFTPAEIDLASAFAHQAALALETARLLQETAASEERYRLLVERALAGVFRTRPDGRLLECNDAFARILGFASRSAALAGNADNFYADPEERARLTAELLAGRPLLNREVRLRRVDGTAITVLLNAVAVQDRGEMYVEGQILDITDRERAAEAERQAEALRSVALLANAAAHEINNPLTVVVGRLSLLASHSGDDPLIRESAAAAIAASQRISEIIARMGNITRIETKHTSQTLPPILDIRRSGEAASGGPPPPPNAPDRG
jgi:PAS domain S-box-containing protein